MAKQIIVTPLGTAEWAKVLEPGDAYEEGKPQEWTLDLVLDPGNVVRHYDFISQIEQWFGELHGAKAKVAEHGWPFRDHLGADKLHDGLTTVRFKRTTISKRGNEVPPPVVVDAKKKPWNKEVLIGNGSKVKVGFSYFGWERNGRCGIGLDLAAVQVIDLVPYEAPDPTGGFGEEEGYEVEEAQETAGFKEEAAAPATGWVSSRGPRPADDNEMPF